MDVFWNFYKVSRWYNTTVLLLICCVECWFIHSGNKKKTWHEAQKKILAAWLRQEFVLPRHCGYDQHSWDHYDQSHFSGHTPYLSQTAGLWSAINRALIAMMEVFQWAKPSNYSATFSLRLFQTLLSHPHKHTKKSLSVQCILFLLMPNRKKNTIVDGLRNKSQVLRGL